MKFSSSDLSSSSFLSSFALAMILLLCGVIVPATAFANSCEPEGAIRDLIEEIKTKVEACGLVSACHQEQIEVLQQALKSHPSSIHLHRQFQDLSEKIAGRSDQSKAQLVERYRAMVDANPEDANALYLASRLMTPSDVDLALEYLDKARALAPDNPWVALGRASTRLTSKGHRIEADILRDLERFHELCPGSIKSVGSYMSYVGDWAYWRPKVERWVEQGAADIASVFPGLWVQAFRAPPAEHAAMREMVRADLEYLQGLEMRDEIAYWRVLQKGYETLGNEKKQAEAALALAQLTPCSIKTVQAGLGLWRQEHPQPESASQQAEKDDWSRARWKILNDWYERCPGNWEVILSRYEGLPAELPIADVMAASDEFLETWEDVRGMTTTNPSPYYLVARAHIDRGRAEGIEELIIKARTDLEAFMAQLPEDFRQHVAPRAVHQRWEESALLVEAQLVRKEFDRARGGLMELQEGMEKPKQGNSELAGELYRGKSATFWRLKAELARAAQRKMDAAVYYRKAHGFSADGAHLKLASVLWRQAGGSDAAFDSLGVELDVAGVDVAEVDVAGVDAAAGKSGGDRWVDRDDDLARLELPNLTGGIWRMAEFKGQRVFANLWATWCGPCRQELPYVQELYERTKNDPDIAVVTLNVDQNAGLVQPFMGKNGFTFPVLFAEQTVRDLTGSLEIPLNWLISEEGTLRREKKGFDAGIEAEVWKEEIMKELSSLD